MMTVEEVSVEAGGHSKAEEALGTAPNCFRFMQGRVVEYLPQERLTVAFPVLDEYLNPAGSMQGGFITAAFDNVFGP
jgi:acyl-coenzyme A thioesterase PaaI-like protein